MKVKFRIVDDRLKKKLEAYPDELMLHLTDAAREITKHGVEHSRKLAPVHTGKLYNSIKQEDPKFIGNKKDRVIAGVAAGGEDGHGNIVTYAYDVHETMAPAGSIRPSGANQQRGGPEGPSGGWFIKRVFDDARNLQHYNDVISRITAESWKTLR